MKPVVDALITALGKEAVVSGEVLRERAVSYWDASPTQALALVLPKTTEEVSQVLAICHQLGQPVVTQGGRTGCVQGSVASADEIILSLERMSKIEDVDALGGTATVQAGAVLQVVQEHLAEQGLLFPLDLGARGSCTIGGNVATNAGGINVLRYGMMRNLVLGLEVVLADGTVVSCMNRMLKNNSGYDLKQLFVGTEGTLGVVTRVVLKLFQQPVSCDTALLALQSFEQVTALMQSLQRDLAGTLSAYEVMWGNYFRAVTEEGGHRAPMRRDYPYYVVLEAEGAEPQADTERFHRLLESALEAGIIVDAVIPKSGQERRAVWDIRENFEVLLKRTPCYLYDVSLPIGSMAAYVEQVQTGLQRRWPQVFCSVIGHIADGNLHFFVIPGVEDDLHEEVNREIYGPLQAVGGAVSAEHGIGMEKKGWLAHSRSDTEIALMRTLKQTLDPSGLLNPGRVFDQ
ncbi:MAG: FAD-binding oxidoreductase [Gammaproteobacteria bacterium]|nr:FAD-binding oxidoreductase [Gammaproteobacteria bacterium]